MEFNSYLDFFISSKQLFNIKFKTVDELKDDCLFVLDTNVLLLPFTVGTKELSEIEKVYRKLLSGNRLFIPSQVAKEFVKNRPEKLKEIHKSISDYLSRINEIYTPRYPVLERVDRYNKALGIEKELNSKISDYKIEIKGILHFIQKLSWDDPVSTVYEKLFTEKCILEFPNDYIELMKELENRHKYNLPPAFKDKSKEDKGIGDFIIWKDIQQLSKQFDKDVIFVTGDEKADWFHQSMSSKLYPRYELQYEFYTYTNGKSFNIISLSQLIELFGNDKEVIDSVKAVEDLKNQFEKFMRLSNLALARANGRCELCNMSGLIGENSILETYYTNSDCNSIDDIVVLCPNCNKKAAIEGVPDEIFRKIRKLSHVSGSPCQMSGHLCPSCFKGVLDISRSSPNGVECNNCGAFYEASFYFA